MITPRSTYSYAVGPLGIGVLYFGCPVGEVLLNPGVTLTDELHLLSLIPTNAASYPNDGSMWLLKVESFSDDPDVDEWFSARAWCASPSDSLTYAPLDPQSLVEVTLP